jgi:hypothetical protein
VVKTNAVRVLDRLGIKYDLRGYEVHPDATPPLNLSVAYVVGGQYDKAAQGCVNRCDLIRIMSSHS